MHLSISNGLVSSITYDMHDDFDFGIVNFLFMDGGVPKDKDKEALFNVAFLTDNISS